MELLQLYYFQKIAQYQSISKAASELMVAQPYLSKSLKRLENELGVLLFNREGRRIALNDNGKILLQYTNVILETVGKAKTELSGKQQKSIPTVRLFMRAATNVLSNIIIDFKLKHPDIKVIVIREIEDSDSTDYDLCIDSSRIPTNHSSSVCLLQEECYIAISKNHRLASRQTVSLKELKDDKFLIIESNRPLSDITMDFCAYAGFKPNIVLECDDQDTIYKAVQKNIGIVFVPYLTWNINNYHKILFKRINDYQCERFLNLSWQRKDNSRAVNLFKTYIINYFKVLSDRSKK